MAKVASKKFDETIFGSEPEIQQDVPYSDIEMIRMYNWYNYMHDQKEAHQFLVKYTEQFAPEKTKLMVNVPLAKVSKTAAWVARLASRGVKLTAQQKKFLNDKIDTMMSFAGVVVLDFDEDGNVITSNTKQTKTIAQRTAEKIQELIGDIEGLLDDVSKNDFQFKGDISKALVELGVKDAHKKQIVAHFKPQFKQLEYVLKHFDDKTDPVVEGYLSFGKRDLKRIYNFYQDVFNALDTISDTARLSKKNRKKKAKPARQQVAKMKVMAEYEPLKLKTVPPEKLVGAKVAFVMNTVNNQLTMYVAEDSDGFTVQRNMIRGFKSSSVSKRFAKNIKVLERLITYNKADAINAFDVVKGSTKPATGRVNDKMVIVKVY